MIRSVLHKDVAVLMYEIKNGICLLCIFTLKHSGEKGNLWGTHLMSYNKQCFFSLLQAKGGSGVLAEVDALGRTHHCTPKHG